MKITMLSEKTKRYSKAHKGPWVNLERCDPTSSDDADSEHSVVLRQWDDGTRVEITVAEFEAIKRAFAERGIH